MKGEEFLKKMNNIDEEIVKEASYNKGFSSFKKAAIIAACMVLVVGVYAVGSSSYWFGLKEPMVLTPPRPIDDGDTVFAKLTISEKLLAFNNTVNSTNTIDTRFLEIADVNPLKDGSTIKKLPVFKNQTSATHESIISTDKPKILPKTFNYKFYELYQDTEKVAEYIKNGCSDMLDMKNPTAIIKERNDDTNSKTTFYISFFDNNGSLEQKIINYNFKTTEVLIDENGKIEMLVKPYYNALSKIDDYPIISAEKAQELLSNGKYIANHNNAFNKNEQIFKTSLEYIYNKELEVVMPFYEIYVELLYASQKEGDTAFNIYYVPAIEEKYIENMPFKKVTTFE